MLAQRKQGKQICTRVGSSKLQFNLTFIDLRQRYSKSIRNLAKPLQFAAKRQLTFAARDGFIPCPTGFTFKSSLKIGETIELCALIEVSSNRDCILRLEELTSRSGGHRRAEGSRTMLEGCMVDKKIHRAEQNDGQAHDCTRRPKRSQGSAENPGVAGGTASGKTTVCDMIIQQLHDHRVVLVHQDSFYRGLTPEELEHVQEYNFDHPDAFDTEQLLDCIRKLKQGQSVHIPIYDFKHHQRCSDAFRKVNASDVIILEGILVFHDPHVRDMMNLKIFVDTDADVRLARRIRRDTVERGRDINSVLEQYAKFVKPAFDDFVLPSKKYADVIIPRGGDNHVAINLIVQHIQTKLGQHDLCKIYPNVYVIQTTFQIRGMHTLIRDRETTKHDFVFYSDRLIRLVVENGLGHLPFTEKQVITPTGSVYTGVDFCKKLCGVSIIRSGESMENALRACCKGIKIGKILIHRDGDNGKQLIYEKLPNDISERHVLLLDPVLATGNSAGQAIELLIQKGVPESHIIFLNLISAPEGIHTVCKRFPLLKIVTSEIDVALNEEYRVVPGMGEFGDRYFGTDDDPPGPFVGNSFKI